MESCIFTSCVVSVLGINREGFQSPRAVNLSSSTHTENRFCLLKERTL